MKYYAVVEIEITDQTWAAEYVKNVTKMVERRGGRYLARTPNVERIEGQRKVLPLFLILEWPSKDAALEFYESEEYRPYRERRIAGAQNEFLLVPGEDVTKTARVPD
jgi:uncharacterized protein (DUF1330 family)